MSCSTSHCTHMHDVLVSCPRHCYTHYSLENAHVTEPQHVQPSLLPTIADLIDRLYVHTRTWGRPWTAMQYAASRSRAAVGWSSHPGLQCPPSNQVRRVGVQAASGRQCNQRHEGPIPSSHHMAYLCGSGVICAGRERTYLWPYQRLRCRYILRAHATAL